MLFGMLSMFRTFTLALIIIIIIIINCRDSQQQTAVYKSYHEKATDVVGDEAFQCDKDAVIMKETKKKNPPISSIYCMINDPARGSYQLQCIPSELWIFLLERKYNVLFNKPRELVSVTYSNQD